jgi:hypothetical protein
MLGVLLKAYMRQAAAEKEAGLVLGHSRGLLTWSNKFLEASTKVSTGTVPGLRIRITRLRIRIQLLFTEMGTRILIRVADPHHFLCSAESSF